MLKEHEVNKRNAILNTVSEWFKTHLILTSVVAVIAVALSYFGYTKFFTSSVTTTTTQTAQVEKGTLVVSVSASGQIAATNSKSVSTNVSGVVKQVYATNNQEIRQGAKIAEIELDQESQQNYSQALAAYQSAKNTLAAAQTSMYTTQTAMLNKWDSFKELSETDMYKDSGSANRNLPEFMTSQNDWLAAEATYKNQQAVVAQAQTALNSAAQSLRLNSPIIYAPISGKVTALSLMKGMVLSSNSSSSTSSNSDSSSSTIANIVTEARPTVSLNLTEIDITKVELNDAVTITIDALPNKIYNGKVLSIDTTGSVSSGVTSYPTVVVFDENAPEVFSNMSAQVTIVTQSKKDVLLVPVSAVKTQNGKSTVTVERDGKQQSVAVELGLSSDTQVEILSGLEAGETIVIGTKTTTSATKTSSQTTSPFSGFGGGGGTRIPR